MSILLVVLQRKNKSAIYNKFSTWQIEECVQDVKAIGVVSLNEFVGVVVVNVFSVKHKHNTTQVCITAACTQMTVSEFKSQVLWLWAEKLDTQTETHVKTTFRELVSADHHHTAGFGFKIYIKYIYYNTYDWFIKQQVNKHCITSCYRFLNYCKSKINVPEEKCTLNFSAIKVCACI